MTPLCLISPISTWWWNWYTMLDLPYGSSSNMWQGNLLNMSDSTLYSPPLSIGSSPTSSLSCCFLSLSPLPVFRCFRLFCSPLVKVALVPIATHSELLLISVCYSPMNGLDPAPHSCDFVLTQPSPHRDLYFLFLYLTARSKCLWRHLDDFKSVVGEYVCVCEKERKHMKIEKRHWEMSLRHAWLALGCFLFFGR